MCLVLFAYQPESEYPLVVAANRDELYARPAQSAHHWRESPQLLAGRDLSAGGTWLGVTSSGGYGYTVGKPIVLGYLPVESADHEDYEIESFCERVPALRQTRALHDPQRKRILA